MSALHLIADMCGATSDVRFVPIADIRPLVAEHEPRDSHGSRHVNGLVDRTLRSKSFGCRKPSEAVPDVAADDTPNRRVRNSSGFAERGGESPSSV